MNRNFSIRKIIAGVACFLVLATGSVLPTGQHTAYAAISNSLNEPALISYSESLIGKVKYKFGVNNAERYLFDCSSFTKHVFAQQGIDLRWGTKAQSKQGKYVPKKNLLQGDLIFFSVGTPGKINHVGIYMGFGKFIHNTIGGSVNGLVISKLSSYSDRYITARRMG